MRFVFYVLVAATAAGVSFGTSFAVWKLGHRYRLYPRIRARDVHTRPTPRLGGIAIFLGVVAAFAIGALLPPLRLVIAQSGGIVFGVLLASLLIVLLGVADDIWDLDWLTKLAGQFLVAAVLAWQGVQILWIPIGRNLILLSPYLSLVVTVFVVVLVMNAVNFIDGLDGLMAGVAIIASGAFFVYGYVVSYGPTEQSDYFNLAQVITAALIGACLGFLPFNFRIDDSRPAKLFMGDGGALLVGLLMATTTVALTGQLEPSAYPATKLLPTFIPVLLPLVVLVVPLLDFGLAVLRRLRAGKSPFSADRSHLHHRLLDMGHSHFAAVLVFYAWTAVASAGVLLILFAPWWVAALVTSVGLAICTIVTLAPLSRRKAVETAVQSDEEADADAARFDPLDAASVGDATDDEVEIVLERLHPRPRPEDG